MGRTEASGRGRVCRLAHPKRLFLSSCVDGSLARDAAMRASMQGDEKHKTDAKDDEGNNKMAVGEDGLSLRSVFGRYHRWSRRSVQWTGATIKIDGKTVKDRGHPASRSGGSFGRLRLSTRPPSRICSGESVAPLGLLNLPSCLSQGCAALALGYSRRPPGAIDEDQNSSQAARFRGLEVQDYLNQGRLAMTTRRMLCRSGVNSIRVNPAAAMSV